MRLNKPSLYLSIACLALVPHLGHAQTTAPTTEVVIKAEKPKVTERIDRKVYRVDQDVQGTTGTAADILNTIPSVSVDAEGEINLRGDDNVIVMIDGKPAAQLSGAAGANGLTQMSASDIAEIEVMTNPSAQYKAEGSAGIINIITKKNRKSGASYAISAMVGNRDRLGLTVSGAINHERFNSNFGMTIRQDDRLRTVINDRDAYDQASNTWLHTHHDQKEWVRRTSPTAHFDLGYALNDYDQLSVDALFSQRTADRYFDQYDVTTSPTNAVLKNTYRKSDGKDKQVDVMTGFGYEHRFATDGEVLSLGLRRSHTLEREEYDYLNIHHVPASSDTYDHLHLGLDIYSSDFSIDYVKPMGEDRALKLGYDVEYDENDFNNFAGPAPAFQAAFVADPAVSNHFVYYQTINAAYVSYQQPCLILGLGFDMLAGLRVEQTTVHTRQFTGDIRNHDRYVDAYPSLHLSHTIDDKQTLDLAINRRVSRPDPEWLNPFSDTQDISNLRAGNPDLKPQQTQAFEASYRYETKAASYQTTAYWRNYHNATTDVTKTVSEGVVLNTKANLPKSLMGGFEFVARGPILETLSYSFSGTAFYNEIDATSLGAPKVQSQSSANAKLSLDYKPNPVDLLQVNTSYSGRRLTPQGAYDPSHVVNLGYRHQFNDHTSVAVTVSDAFNAQKTTRVTDSAVLHEVMSRQMQGQIVFVALNYSFGGAKKTKAPAFDYDQ